MNKTNVRQRLSAQMQFKSLLLLTLLAGTAPAQQTLMPPLALDISSVPTTLDAQCESSRSAWTLRQHATWLLGLKPRQVMQVATQPELPQVPQFELQPSVAELPQLPDMSHDAVLLVQHTEPAVSSEQPALVADAAMAPVVTAGGQSTGDTTPVTHAHQSSPRSLDLRPVLSGPAPALPLEAMAAESLLQVDVSGVDPAKLGALPSPPESLIDSFGFRPPTGFSLSDREPASLAASPSHATPVSIHEGFAPRNSSANQSASLNTTSGPVHNRLSDSDSTDEGATTSSEKNSQNGLAKKTAQRPVELSLSDKKSLPAASPVEISLSDKNSLLASLPVEVSSESNRTSRSGGPEVLTPPSRLAKDAPKALPLSSAMPIASTGVEDAIPVRQPLNEGSKLAQVKPPVVVDKPVVLASSSENRADRSSVKTPEKPVESLIDGLVPPPTLLAADKANTPTLAMGKPAMDKPATVKPATVKPPIDQAAIENPAVAKPVMAKPAAAPSIAQSKTQPSRSAEKLTLTDANPIALKRPVVKAANVAIPETASPESTVVQSSLELDEGSQQLAEYAKLAAKMQQEIKQKFPNCKVKITCNEDGLIAEGHVASNTEASKVLSYVRKTSLCPVADRITTSQ